MRSVKGWALLCAPLYAVGSESEKYSTQWGPRGCCRKLTGVDVGRGRRWVLIVLPVVTGKRDTKDKDEIKVAW